MAEGARGGGETVEPTPSELAQARRVAEAKATVPHTYFELEAPGVSPSTAELVTAVAGALADFPKLNGSYRDAAFELHDRANVAVAVLHGSQLIYPTIQDAAAKSAAEVDTEIERLEERVRSGAITQPDLAGATFSVADLSALGISRAQLAVNRGQAAILAVGHGGGGRTLSLACDSRIVGPADASGFLARLQTLLSALA